LKVLVEDLLAIIESRIKSGELSPKDEITTIIRRPSVQGEGRRKEIQTSTLKFEDVRINDPWEYDKFVISIDLNSDH